MHETSMGIKILVLGAIQGVTEFLPVSSDGHLVLAQHLLGFTDDELALAVWLHLGTLAATMAVYWRPFVRILYGDWRLGSAILVAMIPAGVIGITCRSFFDEMFSSVDAVGFFFWITAAALFLGEWLFRGESVDREQVTLRDATIVGLAQALAILPGVSRSGLTISAGLACGLRREAAARFSFLLAIPTVAGAVLIQGIETMQHGMPAYDPFWLAAGVLVSFAVGLGSLNVLLALLRRFRMHAFGVYCLVLGAVVVAGQFV
jgi:undecaprenyl-diphosphatase